MKKFGFLIAKNTLRAVMPYFLLSWILLSVILFVQQAGRFSDIFFNTNIPNNLIWQLTFALIPSVIAFTCPMAILAGTIIGLSKLQGDSELRAVRAAGVGNFQITIPVLLLGISLSLFAVLINLKGVPLAARIVKKVALQTALYKLESPIEPGVINTEISNFTIYVKDGDVEQGTWKNIFIHHNDEKNNAVRLITAKSGRIDFNREKSELVLESAVITNIPFAEKKIQTQNLGSIRLAINTKRGEIIDKLTNAEETPEELGLTELAAYAKRKEGNEKTNALILWQRKVLLSITPFIFALLGTALVIRFRRGGTGFGIFLALISLIFYYLLALLGEQLARVKIIPVFSAISIPLFVSFIVIFALFFSERFFRFGKNRKSIFKGKINFRELTNFTGKTKSSLLINFKRGLLDIDIIKNILKYYLITLTFLTSIFLIFTAFEHWKFAGEIPNGISLLTKYLFYLIPFIYVQLSPSALMIATLATFVIKSRQNEIVTWTSAGLSVYRLLIPCFVLMSLIGLINWGIQERIAPKANVIQDEVREQIRSRGKSENADKIYWLAEDRHIFSFKMQSRSKNSEPFIKDLTVYKFDEKTQNLLEIYKVPKAVRRKGEIETLSNSEKTILKNGEISVAEIPAGDVIRDAKLLKNLYDKPNHLNSIQIKEKIRTSESAVEQRNFEVFLEKKSTTPFLPLIIIFFTAPFALSLSRKGKVITVVYAVGILLLFMGITSVFEQFGLNGAISPKIAVWSPLIVFSLIGIFLLSRVKT